MQKTPLIQPGDVAIYAPKLNLNDPVDQAITSQLCAEVSDMARKFCDAEWWIMPFYEQYWGKNGKVLMLKHRPIVSITNITIADGSGNWPLVPAPTDTFGNPIPSMVSSVQSYGAFWFDKFSVYLGAGTPFPDGHFDIGTGPNIFVNYTAGYASLTGGPNAGPDYASIPTDLRMGLIKEVVFRKTESQRVGLKSVGDGQGQTSSYSTAPLDPQAFQLIKKYRRTWGAGL
jgi:hypothetical protein